MKRQEWMLGNASPTSKGKRDPLSNIFGKGEQEEVREEKKKKVSSRELNPYFKDGGTGLPPGAELLTREKFLMPPTDDGFQVTSEEPETKLSEDTSGNIREDVQKMVKEERVKDRNAYDREIANKISRQTGYSDIEEFSKGFRTESKQGSKKDISEVIQDEKRRVTLQKHLKMEEIQSKCQLCLESETIDRSLVLSIGNYTYLALPKTDMVNPFHCIIVPQQHTASIRQCDEDTWDEIRNFKKCLHQLANALDRTVLFLETVTHPDQPHQHTHIDVIFLRSIETADPQSYFRKALQDCGSEWSSNAQIINTTDRGGLRKSIPAHFAYCYVDFRLDQGLVHIIEDSRFFKSDFLLDLTANLIGLERHQWKGKKPSPEIITKFRKLFEPFDWTKLLLE